MNLFKSDKDLVWRLVNAVLLIWALGSVVILVNTALDNAIPSATNNYELYRSQNCRDWTEDGKSKPNSFIESCEDDFKLAKLSRRYDNYRGMIYSAVSLFISGGALTYLNTREFTKKIKK